MRTKMFVNRGGEAVLIGLALIYVREFGQWRIVTKEEGDSMEGTYNPGENGPQRIFSLFAPRDAIGQDGDYFFRIYPVDSLTDEELAEVL